MRQRMIAVMVGAALVLACRTASAQERAFRFEIGSAGDVRVVTDTIVTDEGARMLRQPLAPGSRASKVKAVDRATGKILPSRVEPGGIVVDLGRALPPRAEQRVGIEEWAEPGRMASVTGDRIIFERLLTRGRAVVVLPSGFMVSTCSLPAQIATEDGRARVGVVNANELAETIRIEARRGTPAQVQRLATSFRAEDDRSIVYWLEDPATSRIKLALELLVTRAGQSHVYSVLRKEDNITDPISLDVDRGMELKTRIVTGTEATAIGDSPAPFSADARVLVADLGYAVPEGGTARVRLYQTANDPTEYKLDGHGGFRWDRFLARLHTRAVLPAGWTVGSSSHPARVSRDPQGRVVLDFVQASGDSPALVVTAMPDAPVAK